ncbi:MAG: oxygen-independent coproporphyrinogen III oxidase [Alphaproteobacteria bacterium]|nr:oxygen-independent coproporphyrinogen III oxidase [Alphaproteobacteria bacterium]
MDERHAPYAERSLPRYTSYPTAPHFTSAVTGATYAGWLADVGAVGLPLSLYLHVPFCRDICWYCGCNTKAARRREPVTDYVTTLKAEIALVGAILGKNPAHRIHWGGGTPNILTSDDFDAVFDSLRQTFDLGALAEHAIEIDPRTLTPAHVAAFQRHGVTRASLGVQDFNPHVQQAIGRLQPVETVARAVAMLRQSGVAGISFDLMYGLPHQSVEDARTSARIAVGMAPDRLSVFGYAHVPWFKARQRLMDADSLPGLAERSAQADAVSQVLRDAGYVQIGLDHFARAEDPLARAAEDGTMRRNFQGYVDDDCAALVGLGASAISSLPQGYAQNNAEVGQWSRLVHAGALPVSRGYALSHDDRVRRDIIERILCAFEVDLAPYGGARSFETALQTLEEAERDGLVVTSGDHLTIPHEARRLARVIASAFDDFHQHNPARHSRAV